MASGSAASGRPGVYQMGGIRLGLLVVMPCRPSTGQPMASASANRSASRLFLALCGPSTVVLDEAADRLAHRVMRLSTVAGRPKEAYATRQPLGTLGSTCSRSGQRTGARRTGSADGSTWSRDRRCETCCGPHRRAAPPVGLTTGSGPARPPVHRRCSRATATRSACCARGRTRDLPPNGWTRAARRASIQIEVRVKRYGL